jgi:hypothetical protein
LCLKYCFPFCSELAQCKKPGGVPGLRREKNGLWKVGTMGIIGRRREIVKVRRRRKLFLRPSYLWVGLSNEDKSLWLFCVRLKKNIIAQMLAWFIGFTLTSSELENLY